MASRDALVEHCLELLAPLGQVTARRMFGGWGFHADGLFIALIAYERLYLKADNPTRERFTAAGGEPFVYDGKPGQVISMNYWTVPADAMESPAAMTPWARLAVQAALAARAKPAPASKKAAQAARKKPPAA